MKILIVDGELATRRLLRSLVEQDPAVASVAECETGKRAAARLGQERFDLVFLESALPDLDGFDVLKSCTDAELPLVVFVTARHEDALRAFSVAAVDFLIKPVDATRFTSTFDRAKRRHRERLLAQRGNELLELLTPALRPRRAAPGALVLPSGGDDVRIDVSDVAWLEAQNKHVVFHLASCESVRIRQTLAEVEKRLDPRRFLRVHRSCIVALDRIEALKATGGGSAFVVLDSGAHVVVSRARVPAVRASLRAESH